MGPHRESQRPPHGRVEHARRAASGHRGRQRLPAPAGRRHRTSRGGGRRVLPL